MRDDCLNLPARVRAHHFRPVGDTTDNDDDEVARYCANGLCRRKLPADHVIMLTTCHIRRFCGVPCIGEGYRYHLDQIIGQAMGR